MSCVADGSASDIHKENARNSQNAKKRLEDSDPRNQNRATYKQQSVDMETEDSSQQEPISITSSHSRDSLLSHDPGGTLSPDTSQLSSATQSKGDNSSCEPQNKHSDHSAMAFTVDFDEETPKKMNISGPLSEFMPKNLRKSFRERKDKTKSSKMSPDQENSPDVSDNINV